MRKENFTVGDFAHIYNKGNRKELIIRTSRDYWRYMQMFYYFNTDYPIEMEDVKQKLGKDFNHKLVWPEKYPLQNPLVKILAFVIMPNHFHLLIKEICEGGTTAFMRKLGTGMTNYFNTKYNETGRLFQGSYKARLVASETYLKYLSVYIQVKNTFELYPGGLKMAIKEFDKAYEWATSYIYCSLGDYAGKRDSLIVDKDLLGDLFKIPGEYKKFAKDAMLGMNLDNKLGDLVIEKYTIPHKN